MQRNAIDGLTPLRTWAPINDGDIKVNMPSAAQRAATAERIEREAERIERIKADYQQRQAKLRQQQNETTARRETLTQTEQVDALFPEE